MKNNKKDITDQDVHELADAALAVFRDQMRDEQTHVRFDNIDKKLNVIKKMILELGERIDNKKKKRG